MLKASSIKKSYGDLLILKDIDLEVKKGEVISITGPSGAGKSTLLHIIGTLDKPDSGNVTINGMDISRLGEKKLSAFRNRFIGFVFQFHHLLPEFTALENICMPAFIAGKTLPAAEKEARRLLDMLGLGGRSGHKPSELSGGEQQRVAVARALINNPALVLTDEPSGNLDSKNSGELHQLFFDLRDELGQTFVIVTHHAELAAMADRRLQMQDGKIVSGSDQ
ncbi:lipoprotein-releasing system ATP-binding protein [Anseongella ginsenosidimutans]|uniref:Lipoprotein-releasing system ATP-binding protein n=1 Tax=Anseongella ginsenosidimutans TaxID=496056 RepID=A0A4V2UTX3_9SPHI|nr:ABC transporter ATP-binding protein [Anseongella ginsenosidimutans]TCS88162.1 lipoprotein-releasing system ATP-binding protein [Anseongella ginsenosidimutans]